MPNEERKFGSFEPFLDILLFRDCVYPSILSRCLCHLEEASP